MGLFTTPSLFETIELLSSVAKRMEIMASGKAAQIYYEAH